MTSHSSPSTNLIHPRIQRHTAQAVRQLRLGTLNIRSVNNKIDGVRDVISDNHLQILTLTETWHENSNCITIKRLRSLGLNVTEAVRPIPPEEDCENINFVNHGGLAVVYKPGVIIAKINLKLKVDTFDYLCYHVTLEGASTNIVAIYRPGSQSATTSFYVEISTLF